MAEFVDRIKLVVETVTDGATSSMGNFKSKVSEAEGGFGKLKAAGSSAMDVIAKNAGLSAVAAATAVAKFAQAAIGDFVDLAVAAENFATAAGTSVEDASRWLEVAGDLGVSAENVQGAMQRLNREAAEGKLDAFGITADNANDRLIESLEYLAKIPNEADRAKAQFELFGKSGQSITPLIANVDSLRGRLAEVAGAKLIDEQEVEKAKRYRDAIDNLNDMVDSFKLAIGGELAGDVANVAEALGNLGGAINDVLGVIPGMGSIADIALSPLRNLSDGLNTVSDGSYTLTERARGLGQMVTGAIPGPLGSWAAGLFDVADKQDTAKDATEGANVSIEEQAKLAADAEKALRDMSNATLASFNSQLALFDANGRTNKALEEYATKTAAAEQSGWKSKEATDAVAVALNNAEQAALAQAAATVKMRDDQATANGETLTAAERNQVLADSLRTTAGTLDPSSELYRNLMGYVGQLETIPANKNTDITADTSAARRAIADLTNNVLNALPKFLNINVGANAAGASYGPPAGGTGPGVTATAAGGGGVPGVSGGPGGGRGVASVTYVTNHFPPSIRPADVVDALNRWSDQRGALATTGATGI